MKRLPLYGKQLQVILTLLFGAFVNAYGFGPQKKLKTLGQDQIDSLLLITGWEKIRLLKNGTIEKTHPNIYIDFNALAKGYVVDVIGNYLEELGDSNYMIEIGGEVLASGTVPLQTSHGKSGLKTLIK